MPKKPILQDSITGIWPYLLAIDWEEPWLWMLISFHIWCVVCTLLVIVYRKYYPQIGLFTVYLGLAFCSEYINEWAAHNYKLFSEEQYFDSNGMFVSLFFSLPLMCNALVIVAYWMWDVTQTLIKLKRAKIRHTLKATKSETELKDKESEQKTTKESTQVTDAVEKSSGDEGQMAAEVEVKSSQDKKED